MIVLFVIQNAISNGTVSLSLKFSETAFAKFKVRNIRILKKKNNNL